jgi:hypothetical protein
MKIAIIVLGLGVLLPIFVSADKDYCYALVMEGKLVTPNKT